jgi:hypothetical protein
MRDLLQFIEAAAPYGFSSQAVQQAFAAIEVQLEQHSYSTNRSFYVYRMLKAEAKLAGEPSTKSERRRWVVAFPSPDAALSFAQHQQFAVVPRLSCVKVAHLLTVLLRNSTIQALIFAADQGENPSGQQLPAGLRIERSAFLTLLKGASCNG